jgi:hypothetical protein
LADVDRICTRVWHESPVGRRTFHGSDYGWTQPVSPHWGALLCSVHHLAAEEVRCRAKSWRLTTLRLRAREHEGFPGVEQHQRALGRGKAAVGEHPSPAAPDTATSRLLLRI